HRATALLRPALTRRAAGRGPADRTAARHSLAPSTRNWQTARRCRLSRKRDDIFATRIANLDRSSNEYMGAVSARPRVVHRRDHAGAVRRVAGDAGGASHA